MNRLLNNSIINYQSMLQKKKYQKCQTLERRMKFLLFIFISEALLYVDLSSVGQVLDEKITKKEALCE